MWYIGARASRASASATSATVVSASAARAARAASANTPVRALADGPVEQLDELEHGDLAGGPGERVAALDAPLRAEDPGPRGRREQLLEELGRDLTPPRELGDRYRPPVAVAVELDQRAQRVGRLGGDRDHGRSRSTAEPQPALPLRGRPPLSAMRSDPAPLGRDQYGLGSIPRAQLAVDVVQVGADRAGGQVRARRRSACRPSRARGGVTTSSSRLDIGHGSTARGRASAPGQRQVVHHRAQLLRADADARARALSSSAGEIDATERVMGEHVGQADRSPPRPGRHRRGGARSRSQRDAGRLHRRASTPPTRAWSTPSSRRSAASRSSGVRASPWT